MSKWYTLSEAADATGRSRTTIRRYLDQHRFPGARRDQASSDPSDRSRWLIPECDLVALGLLPSIMARPVSATLESEHSLSTRLAVAEALAAERAETIVRLSTERDRLLDLITQQMLQGGTR